MECYPNSSHYLIHRVPEDQRGLSDEEMLALLSLDKALHESGSGGVSHFCYSFHLFMICQTRTRTRRCSEWSSVSHFCYSFPYSFKSLGGLVTVRVGLKGVWIDDSLVVHQLVTFVIGKGVQFVGFGIPHDLMRFDDLRLTRFPLRLLDFIEDVWSHDVIIIIHLGFAFTAEAEAPHFAFNVTILGFVAIILGTARHEFFNVIVGVQLTRKVAEVIAQDRAGLPLLF